MKRVLVSLGALLMAASLVSAAEMIAQTPQPSPQSPAPARPEGREAPSETKRQVEGKIKSVVPSGTMTRVMLDDGTQLTIPASVKVERATLKQGAVVKATYEENRGQKVVTSIEVQPQS